MMKLVRHLLQDKGHRVWSTTPDAMVYDALKLMAEKDLMLKQLENYITGNRRGIIGPFSGPVLCWMGSSRSQPTRRPRTRSPRDLLAVVEELAGECRRRLRRKPHRGVGALLHGPRGGGAAHGRSHPARTDRVHGNPVGLQRLGE